MVASRDSFACPWALEQGCHLGCATQRSITDALDDGYTGSSSRGSQCARPGMVARWTIYRGMLWREPQNLHLGCEHPETYHSLTRYGTLSDALLSPIFRSRAQFTRNEHLLVA